MSNFSPTFLALLKEAQFTKELLGAGATQIRRANYATKGIYFQSFTSLSTGLERIGKLCLIIDYAIESNGRFPDLVYLKKHIGHDLMLLQEKAIEVINRRDFEIIFPSSNIHQSIVRILSDFAKGDRYSNIDLLAGSSHESDPISTWFTEVDLPLFEKRVTKKKKQKISANASIISRMVGSFSYVMHTSETGTEISDIEEASYRTGVYEAVAGHRQLYILHIIRFWTELLRSLQYVAYSVQNVDVPHFSELFAAFGNDDSYLRTRKTWERV